MKTKYQLLDDLNNVRSQRKSMGDFNSVMEFLEYGKRQAIIKGKIFEQMEIACK